MVDSSTILLVDDEASVRKVLTFPLERDGYTVIQAADGEEALERFEAQPVDLVVLDIMLPKLDGLEVCKRLRATSTVPIIMLTARDDELDKVLGLELGADDYITKPFSIREFRSRVKALLRRARTPWHEEAGSEEQILAILARSPGRVFSRTMLLERLWGDAAYRDPRTIDVHIRHLREKIERDAKEPELIFTVRGVGYHFRDR